MSSLSTGRVAGPRLPVVGLQEMSVLWGLKKVSARLRSVRVAMFPRSSGRPRYYGVSNVKTSILALFAVLSISLPATAQEPPTAVIQPVLDDEALLHKYVWSTLGLPGALHATFASAIDQWRGAPPEWSTGVDGYPKRWVSQFAEAAIGSTTKYAVARALHHDPSFSRCRCSGFGPRLRHAVISPFAARARDGRRVFSPATVAALAAENVIPASTWYPAPRGARDGWAHAGTGIVAKIGVDVFREFVTLHLPLRKP